MKKSKLLLLTIILIFSSMSQANKDPFNPVQELFAAMSAVDHEKMKSVVTDDFQLLEAGEDWTIDDLIAVIKISEYQRRNYFGLIKTKISGSMAWVSYWNKATFTKGENFETVAWLESAVLIRDGVSWKIQMLHSTKIKAEDIPKDIVLQEYLN